MVTRAAKAVSPVTAKTGSWTVAPSIAELNGLVPLPLVELPLSVVLLPFVPLPGAVEDG